MNSLGFTTPVSTSSFVQRPRKQLACARRPVFVPVGTPRMGLSVKSSNLPQSQVSLEISVGKEECTAAYESVMRELQKKSEINGFRKGHVPKQIILNRYGKKSIMASACEEVIEKSINKAIKEGGISVIGQARFETDKGLEETVEKYNPDSPLTFTVKVDVWPEAVFTESYEELQVEAEEALVDDALVDKTLEELRQKEAFSVLSGADEKAALGKLVVADLTGYYREDDGSRGKKLPEIADGDSVEINMKEGQYMPGFVEGIIGASAGEVRDVPVEFPMTNPRPELAGLKAIFEVDVKAIKDIVLPELTDEFAQQVSEEKTMADLRETVRGRLGTEAENTQDKNINKSLDDKLATIVEVELPETLVENQCKNKFAKMLASFQDKGMSEQQVKAMVTPENYELYKKRAQVNVEKTLRVNFAISKIAKDKNIKVEKEEIEDQMALVKAEMKGKDFDEEQARDQIESEIEHDLVLKYLKKTANVTLVPAKVGEDALPAEPAAAASSESS